jgi:hypothetical protein
MLVSATVKAEPSVAQADEAVAEAAATSHAGLAGPAAIALGGRLDRAGALALQRAAGNRAVAALARQTAEATVRRFHPAPNLTVDQNGNHFAISGTIQVYGPSASAANAATAQATIRRLWNRTFPDGAQVTCTVSLVFTTSPSTTTTEAVIEMKPMTGPSNVSTLTNTMELNMNDSDALTWVVAHEFGHQCGLADRYSESTWSSIRGSFGYSRTNTIQPGYEGTIMGASGGDQTAQTVRNLGAEHSPWSWDDDDEVRDWINHHSADELAGLPAGSRAAMVDQLMSGWISDEDVQAMGAIAASARTAADAGPIRAALERGIPNMSSIGQRTQVRVFVSQMPR